MSIQNVVITPFSDESLESYLLRLSGSLGFLRFRDFTDYLWLQMPASKGKLLCPLPKTLRHANLYHSASTHNDFLASLLFLEGLDSEQRFSVIKLALCFSDSVFSPHFSSVFRSDVLYPRIFLRKQNTPVCPQCLSESGYIRQVWQCIPYTVCHKHGKALLQRCPKCKATLSFKETESITRCECGQSLTVVEAPNADTSALLVSAWLSGENQGMNGLLGDNLDISARYGVLLWYLKRYEQTDDIQYQGFVSYMANWPKVLFDELDKQLEGADDKRLKPWNQCFFSDFFGMLLHECRELPSRLPKDNPVLSAVLAYLTRLVAQHPRTKRGNIGDVLLSTHEACTLLCCSKTQVYRLVDAGILTSAVKVGFHSKPDDFESIYHLRSVVQIKLSHMSSLGTGLNTFLPER